MDRSRVARARADLSAVLSEFSERIMSSFEQREGGISRKRGGPSQDDVAMETKTGKKPRLDRAKEPKPTSPRKQRSFPAPSSSSPSPSPNARVRWTQSEIDALFALDAQGSSVQEIARKLGKTLKQVRDKLRRSDKKTLVQEFSSSTPGKQKEKPGDSSVTTTPTQPGASKQQQTPTSSSSPQDRTSPGTGPSPALSQQSSFGPIEFILPDSRVISVVMADSQKPESPSQQGTQQFSPFPESNHSPSHHSLDYRETPTQPASTQSPPLGTYRELIKKKAPADPGSDSDSTQ